MEHKGTNLALLLDPPAKETDPKEKLLAIIEAKEENIINYSKKPNANREYIKRVCDEIDNLNEVYNDLDGLNLYKVWEDLEKRLLMAKECGEHGALIWMCLVKDPRFERMRMIKVGI